MTSRISFELFQHPLAGTPAEEMAAVAPFDDLAPAVGRGLLTERDFASRSAGDTADVDLPDLFVPDHYEPNYAYPLLVWLENASPSRNRLETRMRQISDRNYFGISLAADADQLEEQLCQAFVHLRRQFHLNTERVYLLGTGAAGTQALLTGLSQPGWFGGVAALSARWPESPRLLSQFDELRGKRVLLGVSESDDAVVLADTICGSRLLWSAGMNVTTVTSTGGGEPHQALLREIDRWVMQGIEQPELVC